MAHGLKLLTPDNPKVEKGRALQYWTFVLHLAPARLSGFEVCPMRTKGCTLGCLNTAGRGGMMAGHTSLTHDDIASGIQNTIQKARIRRTRFYFENRSAFMSTLAADIRKAIGKAQRKGFTPTFRLNATSDIRWESVPVNGAPNIMALFPEVQFYDYTKIPNRKNIPTNYHLTFSLAESNVAAANLAVANGFNVAIVFRNRETIAAHHVQRGEYFGLPIHIGDKTDLRFLDPRGVAVALYAKGNAKKDSSGFVRD